MQGLRFVGLAVALVMALAVRAPASGQEFVAPLTIVVPSSPGGGSDVVARVIGARMSEIIGQPVIIENKPGAGAAIGADIVAKAAADGNTLLVVGTSTLVTLAALQENVPFDPLVDLAPITNLMTTPFTLSANPDLGVTSIEELRRYGAEHPGKLSFAHAGVGNIGQLAGFLMRQEIGGEWKDIPYGGGAPATRSTVAGETQLLVAALPAVMSFFKNRQLAPLAVTGTERVAELPDVPTFAELGLDVPADANWAIFTTGGTPAGRTHVLNGVVREALEDAGVRARLAEIGGKIRASTPEELAAGLKAESELWNSIIRQNGIGRS